MIKEWTFTLSESEQKQYDSDMKYMDLWFKFDDEKFKREHYCDWKISKSVNLLCELAKEYHDRCESYDRSVCKGWSDRDQCAMPMNAMERRLITENAYSVLRELKERIKDNPFGVTNANLLDGIRNYRF